MPQIPQYESNRQIVSDVARPSLKDPRVASQATRAAAGVADTANAIAAKFKQLEVHNQTNNAKIGAARAEAELQQSVIESPQEWDEDKVQNRLAEIQNEFTDQIQSQDGKAAFSQSFGLSSIRTQTALNARLRSYNIEQANVNRQMLIEDAYNNPQRDIVLDEQLSRDVAAGVLTPAAAQVEKEKTVRDWQVRDVYASAAQDPKGAMAQVNEMDWLDAKAKNKLKGEAKGIYDSARVMANIDYELSVNASTDQLLKRINDKQVSIGSVMNEINSLMLSKQITTEESDMYKQKATDARGIASYTDPTVLSELSTAMASLSATTATAAKEDPVDYLRRVRDLKNRIVSAEGVSPIVEDRLMLQMNGLVKGFTDIRTNAAKASKSLQERGKHNPFVWGYNDAYDEIKNKLSPSQWDTAFMEYYMTAPIDPKTGEIKGTKKDKKPIVDAIIDRMDIENRNNVLNAVDANVNTKIMTDKNGSKALVEIDKNGKPIRVIEEL